MCRIGNPIWPRAMHYRAINPGHILHMNSKCFLKQFVKSSALTNRRILYQIPSRYTVCMTDLTHRIYCNLFFAPKQFWMEHGIIKSRIKCCWYFVCCWHSTFGNVSAPRGCIIIIIIICVLLFFFFCKMPIQCYDFNLTTLKHEVSGTKIFSTKIFVEY